MNRIRVSLFKRKGQTIWQMQYRDPMNPDRKIQRTTGATNKREAERIAFTWECEIAGKSIRRVDPLPISFDIRAPCLYDECRWWKGNDKSYRVFHFSFCEGVEHRVSFCGCFCRIAMTEAAGWIGELLGYEIIQTSGSGSQRICAPEEIWNQVRCIGRDGYGRSYALQHELNEAITRWRDDRRCPECGLLPNFNRNEDFSFGCPNECSQRKSERDFRLRQAEMACRKRNSDLETFLAIGAIYESVSAEG